MVEVHLLDRESIVMDETDMSKDWSVSIQGPTGAPAPNAKTIA
jgi:hypothetical protein